MKKTSIYFFILFLPNILFSQVADERNAEFYPIYSKVSYENNIKDSYLGISIFSDLDQVKNTSDFKLGIIARVINIDDPFILTTGLMGKLYVDNYFIAAELSSMLLEKAEDNLYGWGRTIMIGYQSSYLGRFRISFSKYNLQHNDNRPPNTEYYPSETVKVISIGWNPFIF